MTASRVTSYDRVEGFLPYVRSGADSQSIYNGPIVITFPSGVLKKFFDERAEAIVKYDENGLFPETGLLSMYLGPDVPYYNRNLRSDWIIVMLGEPMWRDITVPANWRGSYYRNPRGDRVAGAPKAIWHDLNKMQEWYDTCQSKPAQSTVSSTVQKSAVTKEQAYNDARTGVRTLRDANPTWWNAWKGMTLEQFANQGGN